MSVRVKICGLRTPSDLDACLRAEVHAVGFNFYEKSKRFIATRTAADLARALPSSVWKVGVFVGATPASVHDHLCAGCQEVDRLG